MNPARKKIAIVITRLSLGGAQQVALETARGLDPGRFEVFLLSGAGGGLEGAAIDSLGDHFVRVPSLKDRMSPLSDLAACFWLWAFFVAKRPDIVHTHSSKAGLLGRLAAWAAFVPRRVHTVHGWSFNDFQGGPLRRFYIHMERALARITGRLVVVAHSCRAKGLLWGIGRPDQYQLIRAGVDLGVWSRAKRSRFALNRALTGAGFKALKPGELVVGCVANCKPQKNPLDFVRVAALALKGAPRLRFIYLGEGPLRAEAVQLAESLGLASQVHFLGYVQDPLPLAAGFDLFLLTSLWEGLPCVFPQALSLGLPVVATQVDGAAEIVQEGVNGYLCQPYDVEALSQRVIALALAPALRRRLSLAAKKSVGREFGFPDMLQASADLYGRLCAS